MKTKLFTLFVAICLVACTKEKEAPKPEKELVLSIDYIHTDGQVHTTTPVPVD